MDENKILIVNLSRGLVGEDNAALLGALLVTKVQMAAMSRADTTIEQRTPFYLYVDEFQNFATDSFATILSEARKYGLNLTVANQYIAQMLPEVRDAVFGNVGSIISFRTSADDAGTMMKYFEPKFTDHDMVHMHNRHFAVSMTIEGEKVPAFSAITLNLPEFQTDYTPQIVQYSRANYGQTREAVERYVAEHYEILGNYMQSPQPRQAAMPKVVPSVQSPRPATIPSPVSQPKPAQAERVAVDRAAENNPLPNELTDATVEKPKRKRTRKRKKPAEQNQSPQPAQVSAAPPTSGEMKDEQTISLK
jgi:hypothetical protein